MCTYFRFDCRSNNSICSDENASHTSARWSHRCGTALQSKSPTRHSMAGGIFWILSHARCLRYIVILRCYCCCGWRGHFDFGFFTHTLFFCFFYFFFCFSFVSVQFPGELNPHVPNNVANETYAYTFRGQVVDTEQNEIDLKAIFDPEIFFNIILPPIIFYAGYSLKRVRFGCFLPFLPLCYWPELSIDLELLEILFP